METPWMKWILIIELMVAITSRSALAQITIPGILECYTCSSKDSVGCGGEFDSNAEGVSKVVCSGYCYKTTYGYYGVREVDRGCEPSSDCPASCFGNACSYCCQGSLCNKATIMTSSPLLACVVVGFATLKNIFTERLV